MWPGGGLSAFQAGWAGELAGDPAFYFSSRDGEAAVLAFLRGIISPGFCLSAHEVLAARSFQYWAFCCQVPEAG